VLAEVAQTLACSDDLDEALRAVHEQLAETLGCTHVATVLRDPNGGAPERILHHAAAPGARGDEAAGAPFPPSALVERALLHGEPSVVHELCVAPSGEEISVASVSCPLRAPDGILGAIVARRAGPAGFDGAQIDLLDGVAREVVLAIAAARRRQEARENAALSAALARVGQELITSVDLPLLLDRLCRVTTEVLGCDASYTFLRDERLGGFVRMASYGDPPQLAEALRTLPILDEQTGGLVERLERDWVVVEHAEGGSVASELWNAYGTRTSMVIALLHGARLVGAQAASFRRDDAAFGPQHLRIGQGIAQLASLAIANAQLVSELEAASRIKSDFVATISHELRTPLNVILGYTDLLLLGDFGALTPQQDDPLRRVRSSATELQQLIEATLDLSRLESGAAALRLEQVDLQHWLDEVRNETAPLCERRPQLDVRWHASLPGEPVRCDAIKLKVILKNLIGNALKFTHQGFVEVSVAAQHGMLTLSVADSGIGMAPEVRAVIFEAFRQGDASMTRTYGGVGLGLYIVRRLVDAMRGRIEVTSEPGGGSEFRVEVPLDPRSTP
jgi:signal transduction histidine kinase